jgi:hypothetical protein
MSLIFHPNNGYGRLGNAIFRYFATILLCNKYNLSYTNNNHINKLLIVDDILFENIFINNININITNDILLNDFYQFNIYLKYKNEIIEFMNKYKNIHKIKTDHNDSYKIYNIIDLIDNKSVKIYDFVLHIRLEDFVNIGIYIKIEFIIKLLNNIDFSNINTVAIVIKKPNTSFELQYINILLNWFTTNNINCVIESNDIITDFQIMKQCSILLCSKSTLSWCAALLSNNLKLCYFPNYKHSKYQVFNKPHNNTIYYDIGEL